MLPYLYSHSLKEMLRLRRFLPWVGVALFTAFMGLVWPSLAPESTANQQYADISSMLIFRVLALASAIYTTSIVSQEVEQKTIVYLLTRPVTRWKLLAMRYLASVTVVSIVAILSALLLSAVIFRGHIGDNDLLGGDIKAIIIGAFCYGALFLLVSLLSSRAMIICILFAFGWELSVGSLPGDLAYLTVFSYLQALAQKITALPNIVNLNFMPEGDAIEVQVREPNSFYESLNRMITEDNVKISGFQSPDNNLESVFRYLVEA